MPMRSRHFMGHAWALMASSERRQHMARAGLNLGPMLAADCSSGSPELKRILCLVRMRVWEAVRL